MKNTYKLANDAEKPAVPWWTSCRVLLALVGFFAFFNAYSQRVGMSVAIICMVNQTAVRELRQISESQSIYDAAILSTVSPSMALLYSTTAAPPISNLNVTPQAAPPSQPHCARNLDNSADKESLDGPFIWDKQLQGHILGAFFYGYVVSQIPGGMLAERFGGKWVFFSFLLMSTLATLLTPLGATISPWVLIVLRILCGIGSGGLFPAMHVLLTRWSPLEERSKLAGFTYSGAWMGNIVSFPIAGILCTYGFGGGWPSIFYIIGMSSVVVLVAWVFLVFSTPLHHPRITPAEREHIVSSLEGLMKDEEKDQSISTPWLSILTSPCVWAIVIANVTTDWGLYTFLTNIPTYMYEVLYFDITKNGALSALPFIGCWVVVMIAPIIADKLISSKTLSVKWTRKLLNSTGAFGGGICTFVLAFITCSHAPLAVMTLTIGVAITGCVYSGFMVNYMDIAPRYAGTLLGLGNCLAALTGFVAPYTVASITTNQTQEEWRCVFYISAAIYIFGGLFFLIFSQGKVQPWARTEESHPVLNENSHRELKRLNGPAETA